MTQKNLIKYEQAKVLEELETIIGKKIPIIQEINLNSFGVKIKGENIIKLGLWACKLTTLPESIGNLSLLKELYLRENHLLTLPESIGNLKSLRILNLNHNPLTTLPESIGNLSLLKERFSIHRLKAHDPIPEAVLSQQFFAITRTPDELSLVVQEDLELPGTRREAGWSCIKVLGPLDFGLTGILAGISKVLADEAVSLFAVSTFDTDYILVKEDKVSQAVAALKKAGYQFSDEARDA